MNNLILSSPTTDDGVSQASIFYLASMLEGNCDIIDMSGALDYYDPPKELYNERNKKLWNSSLVFDENWIDDHIPKIVDKEYDCIYCSALFTMDIILQGKYVVKYKKEHSTKAYIGGAALYDLTNIQNSTIRCVFDKIYCSSIDAIPDYSVFTIKDFITVLSGDGCTWGNCRFCNSKKAEYKMKKKELIVDEFSKIAEISNAEIMLSSDSIDINDLIFLAQDLQGSPLCWNIMLRADKKINPEVARILKKSNCTDVFIGIEIFDDQGLKDIKKGTDVKTIKDTVRCLSDSGIKVSVGLIMFLPLVSRTQLENQLANIKELLPYIHGIEVESLSILQGSDFYFNHKKYGIDLFPRDETIFDYWCYGLSPDIPWKFEDNNYLKMWLEHVDKLRKLVDGYVPEHYWWHIDHIKEKSR